MDLREENLEIKGIMNLQAEYVSKLESDLEALDQYSRRENVCFTNLLVDGTHTPYM